MRACAYRSDGNGRKCEWVANDVPKTHALATVLDPRVLHFPERRRMQRTVGGHKGKWSLPEGPVIKWRFAVWRFSIDARPKQNHETVGRGAP